MKIKKNKMQAIVLLYLFLSLATCTVAASKTQACTKRLRRWKVRPINKKRVKEGLFVTLIKDMIMSDETQFFKYTRMTINQFDHLLKEVKSHIQKDRKKSHISAKERLILTLHYLSEGCSMQEIAWNYRIGKDTAHHIIKQVCRVLWEKLSQTELPEPSQGHFKEIASGFFERWNLPNCIGALDGKHINIFAPKNSGSAFFNYKKNFSLILMATCDAYYRFSMVDIGAEGCNHDSAVFKASSFGNALMTGKLDIPAPKALPKTNCMMPYFLVGDAAFPLHENIVRPYPGSFLDEEKNIFNYRISRARRCIENCFGVLSQRWRILRKPINASLEICELIVQATVILHNYLQNKEKDLPLFERKYCPTGFVDYYDEKGNLQIGTWRKEAQNLKSLGKVGSNNHTQKAKSQRDKLADYFISKEGWIPWQEQYVNRGGAPGI